MNKHKYNVELYKNNIKENLTFTMFLVLGFVWRERELSGPKPKDRSFPVFGVRLLV